MIRRTLVLLPFTLWLGCQKAETVTERSASTPTNAGGMHEPDTRTAGWHQLSDLMKRGAQAFRAAVVGRVEDLQKIEATSEQFVAGEYVTFSITDVLFDSLQPLPGEDAWPGNYAGGGSSSGGTSAPIATVHDFSPGTRHTFHFYWPSHLGEMEAGGEYVFFVPSDATWVIGPGQQPFLVVGLYQRPLTVRDGVLHLESWTPTLGGLCESLDISLADFKAGVRRAWGQEQGKGCVACSGTEICLFASACHTAEIRGPADRCQPSNK